MARLDTPCVRVVAASWFEIIHGPDSENELQYSTKFRERMIAKVQPDLKELNRRDLGPKLVIEYDLGQFSRWHQASGEVGMLFA